MISLDSPLTLDFSNFQELMKRDLWISSRRKEQFAACLLAQHREQAMVFHMETTSWALSIILHHPNQELVVLYPTLLLYHKRLINGLIQTRTQNIEILDNITIISRLLTFSTHLKTLFNNQVSIYSAPITHLSASCGLFMNEFSAAWPLFWHHRWNWAQQWSQPSGISFFKGVLPP